MSKPSVDVANATAVARDDYAEILQKIIAEGHCPFCEQHLFKHHTRPVIWRGEHWLVTENFRPYPGAAYHFLVISLHHVQRIGELPKGAGDELVDLHRMLAETYKFAGSTIVWREGSSDMTGATVDHLHFHVVIGVPRGTATVFLRAVIGFKLA